MSDCLFRLCAIPARFWEQTPSDIGINLGRFVAEALTCERRIAKGINLESENTRYGLLCQRIEEVVALSDSLSLVNSRAQFVDICLSDKLFPMQYLDSRYLDLLTQAAARGGWERFGSTFFPPDLVGQHRISFESWAEKNQQSGNPIVQARLFFLRAAEETGCGVVELQDAFHTSGLIRDDSMASLTHAIELVDEPPQFLEISDINTKPFTNEPKDVPIAESRADELRRQFLEALQNGEPVGFSRQIPHNVVSEVLNQLVFMPAGEIARPREVRVVYSDGSEALPFPLFCLPRIEAAMSEEVKTAMLNLGMISMRHTQLDSDIDMYWFTNREVSRGRTMSETDRFCFERTVRQLQYMLAERPLSINMFQTGWVPGVMGFYRGVVHILLKLGKSRGKSLLVTPFYLRFDGVPARGADWL
jgi:hypothetical protein